MTYTEKKQTPLSKGDLITYHDLGNDGHPEKWVQGTVTGTSEEGFDVLWDDFKEKGWETEYEWAKVTIRGGQILENGERDELLKVNHAHQIIEQINKDIDKPFVTARFGNNWKQHQKELLDEGQIDIDTIIDIAWKQGRRALLMERAITGLAKS